MQSLSEVWSTALREMKKEYSDAMIELWFQPLNLTLGDNDAVTVECTNEFMRGMLDAKYQNIIKRYLEELLGFPVTLELTVRAGGEAPVRAPAAGPEKKEPPKTTQSDGFVTGREKFAAQLLTPDGGASSSAASFPDDGQEEEILPDNVPKVVLEGGETAVTNYAAIRKDEYTFENYIVGNSNRFAHAACLAVAGNPAPAARRVNNYNPLFIYGASGLGKTHLLYAVTNEIMRDHPDFNVIYVKGDEFTNQLVESIARNIAFKFRDKYRQADVLLIDDIQFIAGKDATQEEFFHTFNALYESHKQIIMTSDRPPKEIKTLEDRLRTRFEWGLIVDVKPPDYETRCAILKKKAQLLGLEIPEDAYAYLAENLRSNVRQLEGAVKKIDARASLLGVPVTKELAMACIGDIATAAEPVRVTSERILEKVSEKYGVPVEDIKSRKRSADIAEARHVATYLMIKEAELSTTTVGRILCRDHTTVIASRNLIENKLRTDAAAESEINALIRAIRDGK